MPGRLGRLGQGPPRNSLLLFAAFILFLPWLVEAQQQQRSALNQQSPPERRNAKRQTLEATTIPPQVETPLTSSRRKNTLSIDNKLNQDESAIALAEAAVELSPPSRHPSTTTAGLASPQYARSLEDWEVEDFVLLATVDGRLWARDRKTGRERWHLEVENAMVETTHFQHNRSTLDEGYIPNSIDDYIWIVEPSQNGALYIYRPDGPNRGLINTGLTITRLAEGLSPPKNADPPVIFTGRKNTSMITVDAKTGNVLSWFGSEGGSVNQQKNCPKPTGLVDSENGACSSNATLVLARTDYLLNILHMDARPIAMLKYSDWGPNNYDQDLQRQYHTTIDNKYIYTSHDGGVMGFDRDRSNAENFGKLFKDKLPSPVVRVFDVARPWGSEKDDPELVVLSQPPPPAPFDDEVSASIRASRIFLNRTEDGSWFAMSGKSYPMAVEGPRQAPANQRGWMQQATWDNLNPTQFSEALVGYHSVETRSEPPLTISGPSEDNRSAISDLAPQILPDPTIFQRFQQLPKMAADSLIAFLRNPVLILCMIGLLTTNQRQLRAWIGQYSHQKGLLSFNGESSNLSDDEHVTRVPEVVKIPIQDGVSAGSDQRNKEQDVAVVEVKIDKETEEDLVDHGQSNNPNNSEKDKPLTKKKKNHRGVRGGVKHRKGRHHSQDGSDGNGPRLSPTVEDAVRDAQNMGEQTKLEPDIRTVSQDPSEVSGPVIRIGALEVDTEKLIGTGSNGTMVFQGHFDGREVAVKRMLIQFFDIASQETKLLRESDDHLNVIRYFAQQQAAGFLYIALELCPASLAEVIEKPQLHRDLAQSGERHLPNVLYQITNGLQHLHNLRIVHRDLKPQNILVSNGKDGKPRMLVSDFGLCKKLEGEQSSFRATTAHAAGTSGWRAPELLLDDDAKENGQPTMIDASTDGGSASNLTNSELMTNRRATRAIDIFSLGLIFFYVLTKGSHPFDCGDRYMREVNIRKGNFNLRSLEVLGDYAFEAKDLVSSMLSPEPRNRPQAHAVMAHPFFWSPKKRLNFLCDVSDHFEKETRDPPSEALMELEHWAPAVCHGDFLKPLGKEFVDAMGKQRKYTGTRLVDLLRALRNKKNHYEDMSDKLKKDVGPLPDGYLNFWTRKFPNLLIFCWNIVYNVKWEQTDRFREYYLPGGP